MALPVTLEKTRMGVAYAVRGGFGRTANRGRMTDPFGKFAMPVHEPEWKAACAVIGEIVLLYTALDTQLNHIVIEVMQLANSAMLESVIATLDPRQKIEILKSRAQHIRQKDWQKGLRTHCDRLERVARIRNAVCHAPLIPGKVKGSFEFAPAAATKILKSMTFSDSKNYSLDRMTINQVREIIPLAEKALGGGENILANFARIRSALEQKKVQEPVSA